MADVLVRPIREGDAEDLAPKLRQADLLEIEAAGTPSALYGLSESAKRSTLSWAVEIDGELVCMMGVCPLSLLCGLGAPWLLGSEAIERHAGAFIKHTKIYIPLMLQAYPHLFNLVDARNRKSIAWLRRAGFKVYAPIEAGPAKMLFHPFEMRVDHV